MTKKLGSVRGLDFSLTTHLLPYDTLRLQVVKTLRDCTDNQSSGQGLVGSIKSHELAHIVKEICK